MARRSDHSRAQIKDMAIAAAEKIVAEQGLAALTTRKVAAAIGYTVGTLYLVFKNLDDLVLHLNGRTLDQLDEALREADDAGAEPARRISALANAYIKFATEHSARWRLIYELQLPDDAPAPAWFRDKVTRMFTRVEQALEPIAADHARSDCALAARALWSGVHGVCILSLGRNLDIAGVTSLQSVVDSLIENYLAGFRGSKKGAARREDDIKKKDKLAANGRD